MAPFYQLVTEELKIPLDKTLITKYQENNNEELKKLDERLEDAEKNLGETEISDALLAKAEFFSKIGDKVKFSFFFRSNLFFLINSIDLS
jgi:26S proteasome regulatory subunit N7